VYKYSYSVDDDYTGTVITVDEARDEEHTEGEYKVSLPDGREQHVAYTSDQLGGYQASMEYKDNLSRVDQASQGDNTHGSYQMGGCSILSTLLIALAWSTGTTTPRWTRPWRGTTPMALTR